MIKFAAGATIWDAKVGSIEFGKASACCTAEATGMIRVLAFHGTEAVFDRL
jgi:hypothetical protein